MEAITIEVRKTQFDLSQFDDVTLVKQGMFLPVSDVKEALARLGNDSSSLNQVINDGLKARAMQELRSSADGWHTYKVDAEGEITDEINGPFDGQLADIKMVNNLVLAMAKSMYDFGKATNKEQKRASKEKARDFVKSNPAIREGLAKSAVLDNAE